MGFIDWLKKGSKGLLDMSDEELRREERILEKERAQVARRLERLAHEREKLFQRGARIRNPDLRKAIALEYELKTREMQDASREVLLRSKEILALSRIRQARRAGGRSRGSPLARLSQTDLVRLRRLIADAEVSEEIFAERLDEILSLAERRAELETELGSEGRRVLEIWQRMDEGEIADIEDAKRLAEIEPPETQAMEE